MIIERIEDWGDNAMYRAKWGPFVQYGTTHGQAISNMLGLIQGYNAEIQGL
jgi:hypothetical protein